MKTDALSKQADHRQTQGSERWTCRTCRMSRFRNTVNQFRSPLDEIRKLRGFVLHSIEVAELFCPGRDACRWSAFDLIVGTVFYLRVAESCRSFVW